MIVQTSPGLGLQHGVGAGSRAKQIAQVDPASARQWPARRASAACRVVHHQRGLDGGLGCIHSVEPVQQAPIHGHDARFGVAHLMLQERTAQVGVDRHEDGPPLVRGDHQQHELGAVGEQPQQPVARFEAEVGQRSGQPVRQFVKLGKAERAAILERQKLALAVRRRRLPHQCGQRPALGADGLVTVAHRRNRRLRPVLIGLPRERKDGERRVGLTPHAVRELVLHDHRVMVESGAGAGIGAADGDYEAAGAKIVNAAAAVWESAELIVKVKEPQPQERSLLSEGQILFAYLHLAPDPEQTADLVASGASCIAYETVTDARGGLPLLAPMSRVAGRLAVQAGAWALETTHGGAGILIGGVPGVPPARVVIIGGGVVGENAAEIAIGMGADVRVLDLNPVVLDHLEQRFGAAVVTVTSTRATVESEVLGSRSRHRRRAGDRRPRPQAGERPDDP